MTSLSTEKFNDSHTSPIPVTTETLGTFATYAEAQQAVDRLSDANFPVQHTTIVADGLRMVERVTGRLNAWKAVGHGLLDGALIGAFVCWMITLFSFARPLSAAFEFVLIGAAVGAAIGAVIRLVAYLATGGRRDFTSMSSLDATSYRVMCDADHAARARDILGTPIRTS